MSYMGLFWETGMPEAWALSRKGGDKPEANLTGENQLDFGSMALLWPQNMPDAAANPAIPGQPVVMPGAVADWPAADGKKTKKD